MKHAYTQEQLDQMSDFELNMAVAEKLGIAYRFDRMEKVYKGFDGKLREFNPIKNYNDCMPIAENCGFTLNLSIGKCAMPDFNGGCVVSSNQPTIQRAIVYCFLLMEV